MGITVQPPDVNRSRFDFVVTGSEMRFGLGAIKNVGEGSVENILQERDAGGIFASLDDLCGRIDLQRNNKRVLESLIKSGACDAFGPRQAQLTALDAVLATAQREQKDRASGQVSLFDLGTTAAPSSVAADGPEASRKELLAWEKELLGIYVSEHPLQEISAQLGDVVTAYLAELKEVDDDVVIVAGVITSARRHITQKKALMMFAQLEDLTASVEVLVFPKTYEATHQIWRADEIVLVLARLDERDDQPKLLAEHAVAFDERGIAEIKVRAEELRVSLAKRRKFMPERTAPQARPAVAAPGGNGHGNGSGAAVTTAADVEVIIRFRGVLDYDRSVALFQRIQVALSRHAGSVSVFVELPRAGQGSRRIATSFRARPSAELVTEITREVGEGVVDIVLPVEQHQGPR